MLDHRPDPRNDVSVEGVHELLGAHEAALFRRERDELERVASAVALQAAKQAREHGCARPVVDCARSR